MSELRVVVRDCWKTMWGVFHGATASRIVAALSSEPETIPELAAAADRFEKGLANRFFHNMHEGYNDEMWDAGIVMIDLSARILAFKSAYEHFTHSGYVQYHNGDCATSLKIRYNLPSNWLITCNLDQWDFAISRRAMRLERLKNNPRQVIYGESLYHFITKRCFSSIEIRDSIRRGDRSTAYELFYSFHAEWLLTPLDQLGAISPRDYLLEDCDSVEQDIWSRQEQWSITGEAPNGISRESFAFQYGPVGRQEFFIYQYLVESLFQWCLERIATLEDHEQIVDLDTEREQLQLFGQEWLNTNNPEFRDRTPQSIIDLERRRIPIVLSTEETVIDCNCPLCNLMADMPGPAFWSIDGSGLPMQFAFSPYSSEEEWRELSLPGSALTIKTNAYFDDDDQGTLSDDLPSNFIVGGKESLLDKSSTSTIINSSATIIQLVDIGFSLSHLMQHLDQAPDQHRHISELNRHFDNLREVVLHSDTGLSLLEPVLEKFCDCLDDIQSQYPQLEERCNHVHLRLEHLISIAK